MTLYRHTESCQQSLRRDVIQNDSLTDANRLVGNANRLSVEPEVNDQLFRCASYTAEIRVQAFNRRIVQLDLLGRLSGLS